jgi:hypothetical protein
MSPPGHQGRVLAGCRESLSFFECSMQRRRKIDAASRKRKAQTDEGSKWLKPTRTALLKVLTQTFKVAKLPIQLSDSGKSADAGLTARYSVRPLFLCSRHWKKCQSPDHHAILQ